MKRSGERSRAVTSPSPRASSARRPAARSIDEGAVRRRTSRRLRRLQRAHGLAAAVDLATVLRMPERRDRASATAEVGGTADELVAVVRQAIAALTAMRRSRRGAARRVTHRADCGGRAALGADRRACAAAARGAARAAASERSTELDRGARRSTSSAWRRRSRSSPTDSTSPRSSTGSGRTSRPSEQRCSAGGRGGREAARLPAAGDVREANTTGSKANDAAMLARRRRDQGRAGADSRAGREPRVNPFPLILSSPSGGGKTTIAQTAARAADGRRILGLVHDAAAAPGRSARDATTSFVAPEEFRARRERGEFAESAEVHGHLYGTLRTRGRAGAGGGKARHHGHRRAGGGAVRRGLSAGRAGVHPSALRGGADWSG